MFWWTIYITYSGLNFKFLTTWLRFAKISSINFNFLFPVFCSPQLFAFSYVLVLCQNISNFLKYVTTKWFNENFSAYFLFDVHSKMTFLIEIGHDLKITERIVQTLCSVSRVFWNCALFGWCPDEDTCVGLCVLLAFVFFFSLLIDFLWSSGIWLWFLGCRQLDQEIPEIFAFYSLF